MGAPGGGWAPGRGRRLGVLSICCLSLFIVSLDNTIVNVALPALQAHFHVAVSGLQWVTDSYLLVVACLLVLSGSLGDRFGHRRVFRIGLAIFGVGSLLCGVAPDVPLLVAARILQAVGGSMLNPNSLAIISDVFGDRRERAGALGVWAGVSGLSTALGPILGGILIEAVDYRAIFWVNVPICLLAGVLTWRYIPESRAERPRRPDPGGQVLAIVALGALTYGIIEGPVDGWGSAAIVACFSVAVVGLATFIGVERRRREPLLELRFFRSPPFSGATIMALLAFLILGGYLFVNTLYLQEVRGDSALVAGLSTLPATIVIAVVSPLTGRLVGRSGTRVPLSAAGVFLAAGTLVLAFDLPTTSYGELAVGYLLLGLGFGLVNPPITNTALSGMPPAQAGVAAAVTSTARQLGNALGVAVLGAVVESRYRHQLGPVLAGIRSPSGSAARAHEVAAATARTFTTATHLGWFVATGAGVAITVVALVTTRPSALARARAVNS